VANDLLAVGDFIADALDVDKTTTNEVLNGAPLVSRIPISDTSDGSETHQYNKYTGAPVVGFRAANAGRDYDHSVDTVVTATCTILDFSYRVDYAVANAWRQGPEDLIAREGVRHLAAALFKAEQQIIYGVTSPGDSAGFAGFLANTDYDALADDMVINAVGTTADVQSSLWAFKTGFNDVRLVTPFTRGITLGDTIVTEANDTNHPVYYTPASMYIGLQQGGKYSAGRIANINNATDSKPLTDDLISSLLSEFPAGMGPDFMVCNRTSLKDLQQSRTATTTTGAPAEFPNSAFNVPLFTTDAIVQTEAVEV
tara:strand:- start:128 stop:1063 length:936 start_codon:yes stop_codon:yes gene_type:complete